MRPREPAVLLALFAVGLVLSGLEPHDRFTWLLEVAPVFVGVPILIATHRAFQRNTAVQTLAAIIQEEPEPIAALNPNFAA
jgi:putative membrane protein